MAIQNDTIVVKTAIEVAKETQSQINTWQGHINQITKENRKLRTEMGELAKQGKVNTAEYKQLRSAVKDNSDTIDEDNKNHPFTRAVFLNS